MLIGINSYVARYFSSRYLKSNRLVKISFSNLRPWHANYLDVIRKTFYSHFSNDPTTVISFIGKRFFEDEKDHKRNNNFVNFELNKRIFENLKLLGNVNKFVIFGSASEYGFSEGPYYETSELNPSCSYSESKAIQSQYFGSANCKSNASIIIIRPTTIYGPNQNGNQLIPSLLKAIKNNTKFQIKHPCSLRDYLNVHDLVDAVFKAATKQLTGTEIFNVGSGTLTRTSVIVNTLARQYNKNQYMLNDIVKTDFNSQYKGVSISKAQIMLNYMPFFTTFNHTFI